MKRNLVIGLTLFFLTFFLSGCCGGGGTDTVVLKPEGSNATAGQQLQDLKAAHDQGAINDEEFEKAKQKILKAN